VALEENATLYTADKVQSMVAEAKGVNVKLFERVEEKHFSLEKFFDQETMSVHLKENVEPFAKKGTPGNTRLVKISEKPLSTEEVEKIAKECIEKARSSEIGLVEINKSGATVLQIGEYRIVITKHPFSREMEITAVRPLKKLRLEDYNIKESLLKRLEEKAEGILVAGSPGQGKSTFAQALAEFYVEKGKIVKTIEKPRDLQVSKRITQYGFLEGSIEDTADILLLVRPDYTLFDEIRKTKDFEAFEDLRLAGVGMIGVIHAATPIDAIQRAISRIELGILPQVIDTVVFIKGGKIEKVLSLELTVKVPEGMFQEDLARPVVLVSDFDSSKVEYEIYTYGDETIVVPVKKVKSSKGSVKEKLALKQIEKDISKYVKGAEISFIGEDRIKLVVDEEYIPFIIGKKGKNIEKIEKELGIKISVEPKKATLKNKVEFTLEDVGNTIALIFGKNYFGKEVSLYFGENFLFSAIVGKNGQIRLSKNSDLAKKLITAYHSNELKAYL
jgi:ATPase